MSNTIKPPSPALQQKIEALNESEGKRLRALGLDEHLDPLSILLELEKRKQKPD